MAEAANTTKKVRVGVFFGGKSSEHEVSLATGRYVTNLLDPLRFEAVPLYMDQQARVWRLPPKLVIQNTTRDIELRLERDAARVRYEDLPSLIDFAFIALLGKYGEDGAVQGLLELLKIPYSGSGILASAVAMHKRVQKRLLAANGFTVAKDIILHRGEYQHRGPDSVTAQIQVNLGFPVIVKPVAEGSSVGVSCVRTESELAAALTAAFAWDEEILIEEFISGQEFMCVVIGTDNPVAMLPSEVEFYGDIFTYESKYMPGKAVYHTPIRTEPERLSEIQQQAVAVYKLIGITGYGRVDGFLTKDKIYISEAHTGTIMVPSSYVFQQAGLFELSKGKVAGFKGKAGGNFNPRTFISTVIDFGIAAQQDKSIAL